MTFIADNVFSQNTKNAMITCRIGKRWFYSFANFDFEYIFDIEPEKELLAHLRSNAVDLFTFISRDFLGSVEGKYPFHREIENYAIMRINSYNDWWNYGIKKRERQSVKKAEKSGLKVKQAEINEEFLKGVQKVYNETPYREGRRYSGYGQNLQALKRKFENIGDSDVLGAYFNSELVGILWIAYGDRAAMFRSFVSLMKHRDKCPNNALISEAVRRCAEKGLQFLVYGNKYGFIPSLDRFREHQGFCRFPLPRYYLPLTTKGQLAIKLKVHRKLEYSLPLPIERVGLKLYNSASRIVPHSIWYQLGEE
ncbi:MAG: hypothetical protein ABSB10_00065 [Candidatus Bathyarchaeia archaeon]